MLSATLLLILAADPLNILSTGAHCDGATDDTEPAQAALNTSQHVLVPPLACNVSGLIVPAGVELEISRGGNLNVSGPIDLYGSTASLIGHNFYTAAQRLDDATSNANVTYVGPPGGVAVQLAVTNNADGNTIDGIVINGGGPALKQATGLLLSGPGHAASLVHVGTVTVVNSRNALDVGGTLEVASFDNLMLHTTGDQFTSGAAGANIGINLEARGTVILLDFKYLFIDGFKESILVGDPTDVLQRQGAQIRIHGGVLQGYPADGGVGIDLHAGFDVEIENLLISGPGGQDPPQPNGTTRGIVLGGTVPTYADRADHVTIHNCTITGFKVAIEGFGWQHLVVEGTEFEMQSAAPDRAVFKNTGAPGVIRRYGHWGPNYLVGRIDPSVEFVGGLQGFDSVSLSGLDVDNFGNRSQPAELLGRTSDTWPLAADAGTRFVSNLRGIVTVTDDLNDLAEFYIPGGGGSPVLKFDSVGSVWSATSGHLGTLNVFWDGSNYVIENKTNATRSFDTTFMLH